MCSRVYGSLTQTVVEILHEPITCRRNLNWRTGFIFTLRAIDNFQCNYKTLQNFQIRRSNYWIFIQERMFFPSYFSRSTASFIARKFSANLYFRNLYIFSGTNDVRSRTNFSFDSVIIQESYFLLMSCVLLKLVEMVRDSFTLEFHTRINRKLQT